MGHAMDCPILEEVVLIKEPHSLHNETMGWLEVALFATVLFSSLWQNRQILAAFLIVAPQWGQLISSECRF
jgi:hypothetical protein